MIITQTPLRVSFFGGGTDYPEYFTQHGGATIGSSIDKYTYVTVSPLTEFFNHRIRVSYSKTELCAEVDEIQHPSVRECLRFLGIQGGVEIGVLSDLPARTGLGSSSSFTVGLLHALHMFKREMVSHEQLAAEAVHVERERIKERVGVQDQHTCAHGGLVHLQCLKQGRVTVTPVPTAPGRLGALQERLMIFYTGLQRTAHEVLEQQMQRTTAGTVTSELDQMKTLVNQGLEILTDGHSLADFGELLHQGWNLKKSLSSAITNPLVDESYAAARKAGAVGGKLLGAGGGGFLLLYVEPYNQPRVRQVLAGMKEVRFAFEDLGSRVVFYAQQAA